ncbi:retrovirus-related pol polyprotein from transposon TNT 1-94 [Tanacetum coccineum]
MLANLFTPVDDEFLNEGEHANLVYAHESCKEMKAHYKYCKKEVSKLRSAYDENVSTYDQLLKDYDGALNIEKGLNERVEELEGEKEGLEDINAKQMD